MGKCSWQCQIITLAKKSPQNTKIQFEAASSETFKQRNCQNFKNIRVKW